MVTNGFLTGTYEPWLVCLSVVIAMLAAYAALDLAGRLHTIQGKIWWAWLLGGAVAMGSGIWAMHYIGMEAFRLPIPVLYDWPTVMLSLVAAVGASATALWIVSYRGLRLGAIVYGSVSVGGGIASMHYIGMDAMRMRAMCVYSTPLVVLSVVDAVVVSFAALQVGYSLRNHIPDEGWRKAAAAVLMGASISSMHYVGMAAVKFKPMAEFDGGLEHAVQVSTLATMCIALITLVLLCLVYLSVSLNRVFSKQERELEHNQQLMRMIFENMSEAIVVMDAKGRIVVRNKAARLLLGVRAEDIEFTAVIQRLDVLYLSGEPIAPEDRPTARALRGDFVENYAVRCLNKETGAMGAREITTSPMPRMPGGELQVLVTFRDMTERWEMDEARNRLASIVEFSQDAIVGKDTNGIVTSWNRAAQRVFGYTAEEMVGRSVRTLLPADRQYEEDEIQKRLLRGETVEHFETTRKTKSGKLIHVSLMISPIRDGSGTIVGASKIARDITEKRLLEAQLHQSQKLEAVGQLTGGIAHDFNNLLGVVLGNLDLAERMVEDLPQVRRRIQSAQEAATRGADLTRRLLTFASREELRARPTDLGECVKNVMELAGRALGKEIQVSIHIEGELPTVMVDENQLESAILNLLVNARDAMPAGGSLSLWTSGRTVDAAHPLVQSGELAVGSYARLSISDTGTGMTAETLARAVEPFYTTKERGKGTGLGLAMVYGFVKQSGGALSIYSEVGVGTNVTLYLPFAEKAAGVDLLKKSEPTRNMHGVKVLVVDDEEGLLEIATAYLKEEGYEVMLARSGKEAMEILHEQADIALLVTDIILGDGMNGVVLVQRAKEISPEIRYLYCSGFPADALADQNVSMEHGRLLNKPYQRVEFQTAVHEAMGQG
jgi:PAS domain S-box-containing protein